MSWPEYVRTVAAETQHAQIARDIGVTQPTVTRWFTQSARPDPKTAAAFAKAFSRPVLEAFIAAGFLSPEEARQQPPAMLDLNLLDDDALINELARRLRARHKEGSNDASAAEDQKTSSEGSGAELSAPASTVTPLPPRRRHHTAADLKGLDFAADRSPRESPLEDAEEPPVDGPHLDD